MSILKALSEIALNIAKGKAIDYIKDTQLKADATLITEENKNDLQFGDFVRDGKSVYMVARPRTESKDGILIALPISFDKWYYCLTYCPYSKTVSEDGGCRIKTEALNRVDGRINTAAILKLDHDLTYQKHNPYGCPADIHKFPAFQLVKKAGEGSYIPAIEELYATFRNTDILVKLNELCQKCGGHQFNLEEEIVIWSSTDNKNEMTIGEEALALVVTTESPRVVRSMTKNAEANILLFKRF